MTLGLRAGWGFLEMQQGRSPSVRGSGRPAPPPHAHRRVLSPNPQPRTHAPFCDWEFSLSSQLGMEPQP